MDRHRLQQFWMYGTKVWVPVKSIEGSHGLYVPEQRGVLAVGTEWAVLDSHPDTLFDFCYGSMSACKQRCRILFHIYTGKPASAYPAD